jgi:hypothetical protein
MQFNLTFRELFHSSTNQLYCDEGLWGSWFLSPTHSKLRLEILLTLRFMYVY